VIDDNPFQKVTNMALKSKKKFKAALENEDIYEGADYNVNFEAYGARVEGYVYPCGDMTLAELWEAIEKLEGGDFKPRFQSSCKRIIIRVSFFKAYGWNS
jgi:hypothetical protein